MLAIVIPYYKRAFFEAALESLASQTDKRFRVYVCNDASPEDPTAILDKYDARFPLTYHRFDTNLGGKSLVRQWQRCIALTNDEEWLMILGDDDVLAENVVEQFYRNLPELDAISDVVRFATVTINAVGGKTSDVFTNPKLETALDFLFNKKRSSLSEYIFRKRQVVKIGFHEFPLAWHSDVLAVIEFSGFGTLFSINSATVYIRTSDLNITGKTDNMKLKAVATFEFYYHLVTKKSLHFTSEQQNELLLSMNKSYLGNKKNVRHFFLISRFYLGRLKFRQYFSFLVSIFNYLRGIK